MLRLVSRRVFVVIGGSDAEVSLCQFVFVLALIQSHMFFPSPQFVELRCYSSIFHVEGLNRVLCIML